MTRNVQRDVDRDGREKFGAEVKAPPSPHGEYFPNGEQFGIDALGKQRRRVLVCTGGRTRRLAINCKVESLMPPNFAESTETVPRRESRFVSVRRFLPASGWLATLGERKLCRARCERDRGFATRDSRIGRG